MKRFMIVALLVLFAVPAFAQFGPSVPTLPFQSVPLLKITYDRNLGEVMAVSVNSKGEIAILNHPGTATSGPIYGGATTQVLLYDKNGVFLRELCKGCYGLAYSHGLRYDKYDNLWIADKAAHTVTKLNPAGIEVMNLGRRPEGGNGIAFPDRKLARHLDGFFYGASNVAWDSDDNIYVSDGYYNSSVAKFDKHGMWIKRWGEPGTGGEHANENPSKFARVHDIVIDRQNNVYVADRDNRRIQVFDTDGNFKKFMFLNVPYDKTGHPVLGSAQSEAGHGWGFDETSPWALCITKGQKQVMYAAGSTPGRVYKISIPDGKIIGVWGDDGHELGKFNWPHGLACPTEDVVYVADMNNHRLQRLVTKGKQAGN
jgi:DNA-binding beta-propeller fold protein YncE